MRISPLVILTALALAACGQSPGSGASDGGTGTDTETSSGTEASTTGESPPTTGEGGVCSPGASIACVCPDASAGVQVCNALGTTYGECECEGGGSGSVSDSTTAPATSTTDASATGPETSRGGETTGAGASTGEDTTTGAPACDDPGPEPNDSEDDALDLGEQSCGQPPGALEGVLDGEDDADWFSYHGTFGALCVFGPNAAHTLTAADDLRLCAFVDCDQGDGNLNCKGDATDADSPDGLPGCCGGGVVDFDLDCGLLSDDARVFVRVDQAAAGACVDYSVQYDFDE